MAELASDAAVVQRIFDHIDRKTTDLSDEVWREPVENYRSEARFAAEVRGVLRRTPTPFCASSAIAEPGAWVARNAAGTPLVAVRGRDGVARAFRNACRHRGTQLVEGSGCAKALVCRYHGWVYGLDGGLEHVPHAEGFPDLDPATRGLVPVATVETNGLVFVTQDGPTPPDAGLGALPPLVGPQHRHVGTMANEVPVNWKILVEGFLEGYHILSTHAQTFYPLQYDNLNVIERFGRNSRVTFPYRAVEKLRPLPPAGRSADGKLTYVYHLFPNVTLATFPANLFLTVLDPIAVDRTMFITSVLTDRGEGDVSPEFVQRGTNLVQAGGLEDAAMSRGVQQGLASGANEFFEFGRFEGAIGHFHRGLHAAVNAWAGTGEGGRDGRR